MSYLLILRSLEKHRHACDCIQNSTNLVHYRRTKGDPLKPQFLEPLYLSAQLDEFNNMKKENKSIAVSFRLSEAEYEPYRKIIESTEVKRSALFRQIFINKSDSLQIESAVPKDKSRLVFISNKVSNNVNQLARNINVAHKSGSMSDKMYVDLLNNLVTLNQYFAKAIDKC